MQDNQARGMKILLLVASLVSLVFLLLAAFEENFSADWRAYQVDYGRRLAEVARREGKPPGTFPVEIRQVYLEDLGRVDRCVTCHVAIDDPTQTAAKNPLATHPGELLKHHPADKFGCTICHRGQGRATTQAAAHGDVPHWPEPLLRGAMVYTSCGQCHYENDLYGGQSDLYGQSQPIETIRRGELTAGLPGAENLARGKQLVVAKGCLGCHKYRGRGGALGPDITYVGDKTAHDFDFTHVEGPRTVANWLFTHFKSPSAVVPSTVMPELGLSDSEAHDLAAYMISLKRKSAPATYTPLPRPVDAAPVSGETLYSIYCSSCHGADGVGSLVRDAAAAEQIDKPRELITPSLRNLDTLAVASNDFLAQIVSHGRPGTSMPAWHGEGGLSSVEIDRLITAIRGWEPKASDPGSVSAARGNARYGAALFRANCAGCHGREGEGGAIGVSLRSPSFLAIVSDEMLATTILDGRPNTAMPSWRQFDNRDMSDLLALIRSWQPLRSHRDEVLASPVFKAAEPPPENVAIGQQLYRSRCAVCHGQRGEGRIGPSLSSPSVLPLLSDAMLHDTIVRGRPGTAMPAWRQLASEDIVDLITLLRSWQKGPRRQLDAVHVTGDWQNGGLLYRGMCASCHGPQAEGSIGPQLVNPVLLATIPDEVLIEWISYGRKGTPMRPFLRGQQGAVELSQSQIKDIVTFLRYQTGRRQTDGQRVGIGFAPRGEVLFREMCASCHGPNGEGSVGPAIRNPSFLATATDGFLRATVVLGREGTEMRAMGHGGAGIAELKAAEIDDLIAYLRTATPPQQPAQRFVIGASPDHGKMLFGQFCAGCHGSDGRGSFAPELNNPEFLRAATDGYLQATIIRGRRGTAMRPFGIGRNGLAELPMATINDLVAYVRQWSPDTRPLRRTEPFAVATPDPVAAAVASAKTRTTTAEEKR